MKLAIILPGDYDEELIRYRKDYFGKFISSGTTIDIFKTGGAKSITSIADLALIIPGALRQSMEAEKAGFDGVLLH